MKVNHRKKTNFPTATIHFLYLKKKKSGLRKCLVSDFEAEGKIVYEDMSEGLISEAVYEWAQTLWENDENYKEDSYQLSRIHHTKHCGDETQAELKQMQQHCLMGLAALTDTGRG